jgi:erythromycin esterase-like protein
MMITTVVQFNSSTRPSHVRHARAAARPARARLKGCGVGAQLAYRQCRIHRDGSGQGRAFGEDAVVIGFGTDRGRVAASSDWDGPMEIKRVRPARDDSYEGRSREAHIAAFFLETGPGQAERVRTDLAEPLLERAIGVIYRPETELLSHYFQAELSRQFDAWIWFTETSAVATQEITAYAPGPDETYPFGL